MPGMLLVESHLSCLRRVMITHGKQVDVLHATGLLLLYRQSGDL